ncbi:MAG: arsenite methyltransferase, partial [Acidimicrobiia bacterium]|nr:arsenite methyltransferase [Acidimicrobiia bacterium]
VKKAVRERYAAVAQKGTSCCAPATDATDGCCEPAEIRFTTKDAAEAIIGEADLGLSCGSPTAFGDINPGDTVLDLGSGAGVDVFRAAQVVGPEGHVIGVDMTPDMNELAAANAAQAGLENVEFRLGEIEHLPVVDGTIDLVLSNCVINLVPDKTKAFAEIHRVLAPGGRFVISDIVTTGDLSDEVRSDLGLWADCVSGAIDRADYLGIIDRIGFSDVEVITSHPYGEGAPTESITVRGFKR